MTPSRPIDLWREVQRTVKPFRSPLVRVAARAPRTPDAAVRRIRCLDTAYLVRERLERLTERHSDRYDVLFAAKMRQMEGLCALGSHGLIQALKLEGIESEIVGGHWCWDIETDDACPLPHCWVRVPGVFEVLDVTGSQFMWHLATPPKVVARERKGRPYHPKEFGAAVYATIARSKRAKRELKPLTWDHLRWWD